MRGKLDYQFSYRRNLPHIQPAGATFFVTARLAGSLPQSVLQRWKEEQAWLEGMRVKNPERFAELELSFERAWFAKFESILDRGQYGQLWLKDDRIAAQVAESLHCRDGKEFRLHCFTIMPNHIHLLLKPLPLELQDENARVQEELEFHSLSAIMKSLKGYTARKCNQLLQRTGEFWIHESYDHYVRSAEEWGRIEASILNNPLKAKLVTDWRQWKWTYRR